MSDTRIRIESPSITLYTTNGIWDTVAVRKRERDVVFFRWKIKNKVTFVGDDYDELSYLDPLECEQVTVYFDRYCSGSWSTFLTGYFTLAECTINEDDCTIEADVTTADVYDCVFRTWKTAVNVYDLDVVPVKPYPITETYNITCLNNPCAITSAVTLYPVDPENWCDVPELDADYGFSPNDDCDTGLGHDTCWHRMEAAGSCDGTTPVAPGPDDFWVLLEDNCPTGSSWWRCPGGDVNTTNAEMQHGRLLSDVLQRVFDGCELTVKSDFFNINPLGDSPANDAYTFAETYCQNITVHQKSDVKRPYSYAPASSKQWDMKPQDVLRDLKIIFNVDWDIDDSGNIILEHNSFFTASGSIDYTTEEQKLETQAEAQDKTKRELFFFVDEAGSDYFLGSPIVYDCGTDDKENRCSLFHTDITAIQNTNSEGFSDEKFVLCSTEVVSDIHYLIRDNRAFSFTELHEDLHRWDRAWKDGTLNGVATTFETYKPVRKQPPFSVVMCCDDTHDPNDPVATPIGTGYTEEEEYTIADDMMSVIIKY